MDYSGLVEAIKKNDQAEINRLLNSLIPKLVAYLRIDMNAAQQDAEDCAQQALLILLEAVQNNTLEQPDRIFAFLITTCRNKYLNIIKRRKRQMYDNFSTTPSCQACQLQSLLGSERKRLLKHCLDQLSEGYKTYIEYWFQHPDADAKAAALHFGISPSNACTRKHRVINKLSECYRRKHEI
jgi:RNA polymerase sigma factor (sigma-70 family)